SPPGRGSGARAARAAAPGVQPPSTTFGNPPEPVARSAEPRLSCGAWFGLGFVGSPVGNTTGDFVLALGLVARFKLAASAVPPIDADRRQIFHDNSRCSGPWGRRTGFPLAL